jgi:hypothetical protein
MHERLKWGNRMPIAGIRAILVCLAVLGPATHAAGGNGLRISVVFDNPASDTRLRTALDGGGVFVQALNIDRVKAIRIDSDTSVSLVTGSRAVKPRRERTGLSLVVLVPVAAARMFRRTAEPLPAQPPDDFEATTSEGHIPVISDAV